MAKHTCKQTSKSVASKASSILRDGRCGAKTKSSQCVSTDEINKEEIT